MRVSTNQLYSQSLSRILELQSGTRDLQGEISSGKRIQTPADDPVGAAAVMQIQQQLNASDQYGRNGAQATQRLTQTDDTLISGIDQVWPHYRLKAPLLPEPWQK